MNALTHKQLAILHALNGPSRPWMSRQEMEPFAGLKGYSRALGAPTRGLRSDSLESRGLVRRLDDTWPFRYQITPSGCQVLTGNPDAGICGVAVAPHPSNATPDVKYLQPVPTTTLAPQVRSSISSTPHDLVEFAVELRRMIGAEEDVRSFVCSGNPFSCQVAIVGANPGTTTSFWPHWSDVEGMSKEAFLEEYRRLHNGKYRRSRAAIERFVPLVNARVIELNAHGKQSRRLAELASEHRETAVMEFVLRAVRPRVAICAGSDALKAVKAVKADWQMKIIAAKHFIYWGREREHQMAQEINDLLSGTDHD